MAHLRLQVLAAASAGGMRDPRMTLQEALARHHIENNPGDFEAHYNLAAMLQLRGATQEALEQYQQALTLRPGDATVENALGGALLASHRIPEAIARLAAAVNARPEYFDAHYNLGIAQAMAGNFPAAVEELAIAVKLKPDDAGAEANLGAAYGELGDTQKAIMHLNRALQLDPGHAAGGGHSAIGSNARRLFAQTSGQRLDGRSPFRFARAGRISARLSACS
jgi:Flp pilus assembly protein TadD